MENKAWLWRKKSSEKTIIATNGVGSTLIHHEEERYQTDKELERSVRDLSEQLSSLLCDCNAKDDLVAIHSKMAEEAIAGRERAEAEVIYLRQQLEEALRQGAETKEKLLHSEVALKENMQKLDLVQEEQEQKIHDMVVKASLESDKVQTDSEGRLTDMSKRVGELAVENRHLSNALLIKEKLVEDLQKRHLQGAAEMNVLISRLDSTEKENAFLKYEFHMLEKELDIRSQELEYSRHSADTLHKQQLDSLKKIAKLEAECLRLRLLLQKRLSGSAGAAKMKTEVEISGRDHVDTRRRKLNLTRDLSHRATTMESSTEIPCEISRKKTELYSSWVTSTKSASRSSNIDIGSEDSRSSVGSLADSLASELEHTRIAKPKSQLDCKAIVVPDMSLMDDFIEMERLALVNMDLPSQRENLSDFTGKKITPVVQYQFGDKLEKLSNDVGADKPFDWLQEVLSAILKQNRITKQSVAELLDDVKIALGFIDDPTVRKVSEPELSKHAQEHNSLKISGYITWKGSNATPVVASRKETSMMDTAGEVISNQNIQSDLMKSIPRIIKLIEKFSPMPVSNSNTAAGLPKKNYGAVQVDSAADGDYFLRIFQWKASDLSAVLHEVLSICNDLVNGKADKDRFVKELISSLEWIINNCIVVENASDVKDRTKETTMSKGASSYESSLLQLKFAQSDLQEENRKLKDALKDIKCAKNELEARLELSLNKNAVLASQVQESEQSIQTLRKELEAKESKGMMEDQIENLKLVNEDLHTQLAAAKGKVNEALQKFSTMEVELEDKSNYCEELEAICLDLQLELESMIAMGSPKNGLNQEKRQPQTGWEITEASAKFTEPQGTIQNQELPLKSLNLPKEAASLNKAATAVANKKRASLRDQLLAEDNVNPEAFRSPKSIEITITAGSQKPLLLTYEQTDVTCAPNLLTNVPETYLGLKHDEASATTGEALAIVPSKKKQGKGNSLWKLFLTNKRS